MRSDGENVQSTSYADSIYANSSHIRAYHFFGQTLMVLLDDLVLDCSLEGEEEEKRIENVGCQVEIHVGGRKHLKYKLRGPSRYFVRQEAIGVLQTEIQKQTGESSASSEKE